KQIIFRIICHLYILPIEYLESLQGSSHNMSIRTERSRHHYPRPRVRRIITRLSVIAFAVAALAVLIQFGLALTVGPLFCGTAVLTAILIIPLAMRTVLHPEISVYDDGLSLHPMIWPPQFIAWDALRGIVSHPLVYNDEAMG